MNINGACHCGKVSFSAQIDPEKVMICNCADCQTLSGAPFRTIVPGPHRVLQLYGRDQELRQGGRIRLEACPGVLPGVWDAPVLKRC